MIFVVFGSFILLALLSPPQFPKINSQIASRITCPIRGDKWIVITSIFYPTQAIYRFLALRTPWNVIIIGDRKTPRDWVSKQLINNLRLLFLSIEDQRALNLRILQHLPEGSYARKIIGYLVAIACGARVIFESDDDNILDSDDIRVLPKVSSSSEVP